MTEKWTPGEWSLEGTTIYALNEEGANIFQAQVSPGFKDYPRRGKPTKTPIEEVLANAHLIAAAPDMAADHAENSRILGYLLNELQGLVPAGKLAALAGCKERSDRSYAKARGEA